MTVKELREILKEFDPDQKVYCFDEFFYRPVERVDNCLEKTTIQLNDGDDDLDWFWSGDGCFIF